MTSRFHNIPVVLVLVSMLVILSMSSDVLELFPEFAGVKTSIDNLNSRVGNLNSEVDNLKVTTGKLQTIYTRWGRTDCHSSTLLYSGYVAGGHSTHSGSAANYLCLVKDPNYSSKTRQQSYYSALIYGAEYEDNVFGTSYQNYDVPCAVCVVSQATSVVMIPGKTTCPAGMTYHYWGLLATGSNDMKAAGEYICMDNNPQKSGSSANHDGVLLLPVQTRCGSLPCAPYKQYDLVTCVVCSK